MIKCVQKTVSPLSFVSVVPRACRPLFSDAAPFCSPRCARGSVPHLHIPLSPVRQIRDAKEGRLPGGASGRPSAALEPASRAPDGAPPSYDDLALEDRGFIDVKSKGSGNHRLSAHDCVIVIPPSGVRIVRFPSRLACLPAPLPSTHLLPPVCEPRIAPLRPFVSY